MAMLTPNKIRGYQFQQAGRGTYKSEEVDDFLSQIVESYEQVFKENGDLVKKLNILATKLNEYRNEEGNISKALVNAQSFIDKMLEEANKESKKIVAEAEERAKNVDSITNSKIKVMVDEVEGKMRLAYDKAMAQAKSTKDNAYKEAETLVLEARQKAEKTVDDARAVAAAIISDATKEAEKEAAVLKEEIEKEKALLDNLKETSNQFKTELVVLYERQIKSVEQIPDYRLDGALEEKVKKIVEEKKQEEEKEPDGAAVEKIVDTFVASEDDFFDADDLIREYATKDSSNNSALTFDFDIEEEEEITEEKEEDIFSFDLDEEEVAAIEEEVEDAVEKEIEEEIEKREIEIEEELEGIFEGIEEEIEIEEEVQPEAEEIPEEDVSFDFVEDEAAIDEYEDIFSDSGSSEGFRFTAEDLEEIDSIQENNEEEAAFEFKTEDVDIFSEEAAKNDIPVSKPERHRKFDVAFSDDDAVKIEKDESLFLNQNDEIEIEEEKTGFKFFEDIDFAEEPFDIETDDTIVDTDDIFGKADNDDDDSEGFSFLKNIFGKNN